ncbi:MAG: hypothetical protein AAF512_11455, partial [Pseudomonadota bacterium]
MSIIRKSLLTAGLTLGLSSVALAGPRQTDRQTDRQTSKTKKEGEAPTTLPSHWVTSGEMTY